MLEIWHVWILAGILLWILEIFTTGFILGIFGTSCFLVAILAYLKFSLPLQLFSYAVITIILSFSVRPILLKYFYRRDESIKTNVEALIGKEGIVTDIIDPLTGVGEVKIGGEVWRAHPMPGVSLEKGQRVIIRGVEGSKVIVEKTA